MTVVLTRQSEDDPIIFVPLAGDDPTEAVATVLASVTSDGFLAVDVETTGLEWSDTVRTIQLGSATHAVVLDVECPLHRSAAADALGRIVGGEFHMTAHNAAFDCLHLDRMGLVDGIELLRHTSDTYTLASLIESPESASTSSGPMQLGAADPRGLKALCQDWLPHSYSAAAEDSMKAAWAERKWRGQQGWVKTDIRDPYYLQYGGADVIDAARLCAVLHGIALQTVGAEVIRREHEMLALAGQMQKRGYLVDLDALAADEAARMTEIERLSEDLRELGIQNPASTPQVKAALESELGRAVESTDKATLKTLLDSSVAQAVLAYRTASKTASTYTTAWPRQVDSEGKLHPSINPLRASTGRFSMSNPNLQNVPGSLRRYIVAEPGMTFIAADFSAIEVRVGAALAGDERLIADFRAGLDPYLEIAKIAYSTETPTKEQRNATKPVLLGRMYGRSADSLAKQRLSEDPSANFDALRREAAQIMSSIDRRYPALRNASYTTGGRTRIGATRHVLSSGRSITIDPANARNTFNGLVQGTARELLIDAGLALIDAGLGGDIWLSIHDEWIAMVPEDRASIVLESGEDIGVKGQMEKAMTTEFMGVPITVSAEVLGTHWRKA